MSLIVYCIHENNRRLIYSRYSVIQIGALLLSMAPAKGCNQHINFTILYFVSHKVH